VSCSDRLLHEPNFTRVINIYRIYPTVRNVACLLPVILLVHHFTISHTRCGNPLTEERKRESHVPTAFPTTSSLHTFSDLTSGRLRILSPAMRRVDGDVEENCRHPEQHEATHLARTNTVLYLQFLARFVIAPLSPVCPFLQHVFVLRQGTQMPVGTRQAHDEIGGFTRGFGEVAQGKAYRNWVVRTIVTIETATRFFPNACRCSFLPPPRPHESTRQKQSQAERTILHFFGGGRRIFGRELRHLLRCRNAKRSSDLHARHTRRGGRIRPSSCVAYSIRARGTSLCTAFGVRVVEPAPRKRPAAVRTRVVAVIVGRPSTTRSHHGCRLWEANSLAR
jgi:hypothetical protein